MRTASAPAAIAALVLAASLPAAAQALKPGLWEITSKGGGNPQMEQAMAQMQKQLASMPPEQRRQMEELMASQGVRMAAGAGGGMTVQMCMTREMAARDDVPMQDGCQLTSRQRSGNTMKMAFTCASPPSSGEGQVTFTSPEAYSSRMTVRTTVQGKPQSMDMDGSGKWLRADCGSVRPAAK